MNENIKLFLEKMAEDQELQSRFSQITDPNEAYDLAISIQPGYTKEEFIETEEDALDAVCELINCMNGLYASEKSSNGTSFIELEPPEFFIDFSEAKSDFIDVMPVFICGGEVKLFISTTGGWEVQ